MHTVAINYPPYARRDSRAPVSEKASEPVRVSESEIFINLYSPTTMPKADLELVNMVMQRTEMDVRLTPQIREDINNELADDEA